MWQSYRLLESAGAEGLSQQQLGQRLGQGKLEARTICRNLLRRKLVVTVMKDIGRQRVTCYVARRWQHLSHGATQYRVEKDKNDQLLGSGLKIEVKEEEETLTTTKEATRSKKRKKKKAIREEERDQKRMKKERRSTGVEEEKNLEEEDGAAVKDISPAPGVEEDESAIQISISSGFHLREVGRKKGEKEGGGAGETFRQLRRANTIIEAVKQNEPLCLFLDARGGCGKTFLLNAILDALQIPGTWPISPLTSAFSFVFFSPDGGGARR